jgi:electron transfer flavoprotein beta subunit
MLKNFCYIFNLIALNRNLMISSSPFHQKNPKVSGGIMIKIAVLAKQVPDTANVTGEAMKADGTVNRAALPAVYNPEDLNALEMALQIKEKLGGSVQVISMGPPKAIEVLKHSLYMGADNVCLISDRKFAGADTLATSYVLAETIKHMGGFDLILAGRQAIDGDTAQVGPQVAEKLGFNFISYVNHLVEIDEHHITVDRDAEIQTETIKTPYPVLMTVMSTANTPRYPNAHIMRKYFKAQLQDKNGNTKQENNNQPVIPVLNIDDLGIDAEQCGLSGSPTKVNKIKSITLSGGNLKLYENTPGGVMGLVKEIIKDYVEVEEESA